MDVVLYGSPRELQEIETVLKTANGAETISLIEDFAHIREWLERYPDGLVFLDADSGSKSWQYLIGELSKISVSAKFVLLSCAKDEAVKAYDAGVFDYLLKPVKERQLMRVIAKYELQCQHDVYSKNEEAGDTK